MLSPSRKYTGPDNNCGPDCDVETKWLAKDGDALPIAWIPRNRRLVEKLATSDVSTADLIGEIDPIRIAQGRTLEDETAVHFGLVPRAHRGIFAINELPDLSQMAQDEALKPLGVKGTTAARQV